MSIHVLGGGLVGLDGAPQLYKLTAAACLRSWQSDFGVATGGTPLASGTVPPVVTLTGAIPTCIAFRLEVQSTGALNVGTFRYGIQNTGSTSTTWIEQNVTIPLSGTYAAIAALVGVTINFPAGTYTNDDVYQGTCSSWTDCASGVAATQGTAANQPLILWNATINRLFLRGDGSNDFLRDATLNLPLPGTTPTFFWLEFSQVSWTANDALFCTGTTGGQMQCFQHTSSPTMAAYNNVIAADNNGASLGTATRGEVYYSNSTSDYTKLASTTVTGVSFGNQDPPAGINLLATSTGASAMNADLYTLNIHSALPSVAERAALTAASAARGFAA